MPAEVALANLAVHPPVRVNQASAQMNGANQKDQKVNWLSGITKAKKEGVALGVTLTIEATTVLMVVEVVLVVVVSQMYVRSPHGCHRLTGNAES